MTWYVKGTNTLVKGSLERLSGVALIADRINADGSIVYEGRTEVWWDEQKTVCRAGADGKAERVFVDEDGEEHLESEVEWREYDPEEDEE